jgi:hypothetical protein
VNIGSWTLMEEMRLSRHGCHAIGRTLDALEAAREAIITLNETSEPVDPTELQKLKESSDVFCFDQTSEMFR